MAIPFIDLQQQYQRIKPSVDAAIHRVLDHGKFIMGPEVSELESRLAEFAGCKHCIACASGTDALLMPLMAWGIGPGDAVFTSTFTFISTAEVIALVGATPVFVDIDGEDYNLDPADLERKIEQVRQHSDLTPRAVIPVDLFGLPADYDAIAPIAADNGLLVLEDAAQAFGAVYKGQRACSLAEVAATSFFPAKPLGCYGDGGAVFTDDGEIAAKLESIRVHGKGPHKYTNVRIGINGRLDTMQAAVLLEKLAIYPDEIDARQRVARKYAEALAPLAPHLKTPAVPEGATSVWAQYTVECRQRESVMAALKEGGVPTAIYYPTPLHLQEAFASLGYKRGDFPVAETAADAVFSLPFHPYVDDAVVQTVAESIKGALR